MSKSRADKKFDQLKAYYRAQASDKAKELHIDLVEVRHEYVPHNLKNKFMTGLALYGTVYLSEKLIFGKRLPRIVRFTTSLAATVMTPKVYRLLEDKLLGIGKMRPIEVEMLEDQQRSSPQPGTTPVTTSHREFGSSPVVATPDNSTTVMPSTPAPPPPPAEPVRFADRAAPPKASSTSVSSDDLSSREDKPTGT